MPALILAYPLLVHLAIVLHQPLLQWLALCCLVTLPFYPALKRREGRAALLWMAALAALYALTQLGGAGLALAIPPILLPLLAASFFGNSLRAGAVPLITRIARATRRDPLPDELVPYTRKVTVLWTLLLIGMALLSLLLALFATPELWSLFTNFLNYVLLALVFPLEYLWRRLRYRHLPHASFIGHIRDVATTNYRRL